MNKYSLTLNADLDITNGLPEWLLFIPAGRFTGRNNKSWVNNNPDAVIARNLEQDRDIVFDFEHSTALKAPQGDEAPASGWIKPIELQNRNGEIWGRVVWTEKGETALLKREYRYYSTGFIHDSSGHIVEIHHIGLTNRPNLYELPALNHQSTQPEDNPMPSFAILLGLKADASEEEQADAIKALQTNNLALNSQRSQFDSSKFVPIETHQLAVAAKEAAEEKLALNAQSELKSKAEALIDSAVEDGKVAPANREHFLGLCSQENGLEQVSEMLKIAPKIIQEEPKPKAPIDDKPALTDEELSICSQSGLDPKEFLAMREKENL